MNKTDLLGLSIIDIENIVKEIGFEKYRAKQIYENIYKGKKNINEITNLPKKLKLLLDEDYYITNLEHVITKESKLDETKKVLFKLKDLNIIESVVMKYKHGYTLCISSQIGCKMGCEFCASSKSSFVRNLSAGELIDQILSVQKLFNIKVSNVVLMGIGEPLENLDNVIRFIEEINQNNSMNISKRNITISTCGLIKEIKALAEYAYPINLAISLHNPVQEEREKIMPIAKTNKLPELMDSVKHYIKKTNRRVTFEYALIKGNNDNSYYAKELSYLLSGLLAHVNIIPINPIDSTKYLPPDNKKMIEFKNILERNSIAVTIRRSLGKDIDGACGQLRNSKLKE